MSETKTKQVVVNVSDEQKAELAEIKAKYNLTDKGVIALLLEVAANNQVGLVEIDGEVQEVDALELIVKGLGLAKPVKVVVEKVELTPEEKEILKAKRKIERLKAKLAEEEARLNPVVEEELDTVVVVGEGV